MDKCSFILSYLKCFLKGMLILSQTQLNWLEALNISSYSWFGDTKTAECAGGGSG